MASAGFCGWVRQQVGQLWASRSRSNDFQTHFSFIPTPTTIFLACGVSAVGSLGFCLIGMLGQLDGWLVRVEAKTKLFGVAKLGEEHAYKFFSASLSPFHFVWQQENKKH